jgi:hypothetical protein
MFETSALDLVKKNTGWGWVSYKYIKSPTATEMIASGILFALFSGTAKFIITVSGCARSGACRSGHAIRVESEI